MYAYWFTNLIEVDLYIRRLYLDRYTQDGSIKRILVFETSITYFFFLYADLPPRRLAFQYILHVR